MINRRQAEQWITNCADSEIISKCLYAVVWFVFIRSWTKARQSIEKACALSLLTNCFASRRHKLSAPRVNIVHEVKVDLAFICY